MPVAVNHQYVVRHLIVLHITNELLYLALRIGLILAVPVAEHVFRREGLTTGNADVVAESVLVLMPIAEEIPVYGICIDRRTNPGDAIHFALEGEGAAAVTAFNARRLV